MQLEEEDKPIKKYKKDIIESDGGDSSSSVESLPLALRKESSGTKRKAEVLSKLFPKESGKIGLTITTTNTSPMNLPKVTKSNPNGNKTSHSHLNEVYLLFILKLN